MLQGRAAGGQHAEAGREPPGLHRQQEQVHLAAAWLILLSKMYIYIYLDIHTNCSCYRIIDDF